MNISPKTDKQPALNSVYQTKHQLGEHNVCFAGMDLHKSVFLSSTLLILCFVVVVLLFPSQAQLLFADTKNWAINHFDWLFILSGNIFVLFCLTLLILPIGNVRLGGKEALPEFNRLSWFAMLFAAGMGIGLMFWSVAEPVAYYTNWYGSPLNVGAGTAESAKMAMAATMFHWGLHPWAIYAVVGLSLAFFSFNCNLPLTLRSAFFPLLKEKVWHWPGNIIDSVAVLATIFGLATSLGFGAKQAASGLSLLFDIPNNLSTQITIIILVTLLAIVSVAKGLDKGVKRLSNLNMSLALILLLFVFISGSTFAIINGLMSTLIDYFTNIIPLSNWLNRDNEKFFHGWTVFYWAWWISWSPFVGMFIARISRGRTIKEFIFAVLLVPIVITCCWMTTFGTTAIMQVERGIGQLAYGLTDSSMALFHLLANLPYHQLSSLLAIILVLIFFITSSDSGSLVIGNITAGGKLNNPVPQRIFWATLQGIIAAVLLFGGGDNALGALQAAVISVGLPFTVILLIMTVSLIRGLSKEYRHHGY